MPTQSSFDGARGTVATFAWESADARYAAVIVHGYGEHARRYDHVADALVADGAAVYALDHHGHGQSEGERALVSDQNVYVGDLDVLVDRVRDAHPGLPLLLVGHSMGGLVCTLYVQQHGEKVDALVLSGPIIGGNPAFSGLLEMDPIPDVPLDPAALSRDPAVGEAYAADELVYHGPFKRETLESMVRAVEQVAGGPKLAVPTLWIHGENDMLAPLEATRAAVERVRTDAWSAKVYPGAMHEILNETNNDEVLADVVAFAAASLGART